MNKEVAEIRELLKAKLPTFGICFGHQLLGRAFGAETFKLVFGHRGGNQPVKELSNTNVEITSHNHGFAVSAESLPPEVEVTHINLNDQCVEGMRHRTLPVISVQYHPEAAPGPHDAEHHFQRFVALMEARGLSPRSGRKHKAWGASPRIAKRKYYSSPRRGWQRVQKRLSPTSRAQFCFLFAFPGACAKALCCRPLRRLDELPPVA